MDYDGVIHADDHCSSAAQREALTTASETREVPRLLQLELSSVLQLPFRLAITCAGYSPWFQPYPGSLICSSIQLEYSTFSRYLQCTRF